MHLDSWGLCALCLSSIHGLHQRWYFSWLSSFPAFSHWHFQHIGALSVWLVVWLLLGWFSICCELFPHPLCCLYLCLPLHHLFGSFIAAYIALTSIVLVDICGIENLTSAFGLLTVFRGAASNVGPPLAGVVYEATISYSVSFYLSGASLIMAAVFSILADIVRRRERD